jgi:hypothetical protein
VIVDIGDGPISGKKVAFSRSGDPYVVWGGDGSEIFYVFYDSVSWSDRIQVNEPDSSGEDDLDPGIAIDDNGWIHFVWAANSSENPYDYEIMYRCFDGVNWTEEVRLNEPDGYGDYRPRAAATSSANVWVAWDKGYSFWEHHMRAIQFNGIDWENEEVISDAEIMFNSCDAVAVDSSGNPWVIWGGIEDPADTKSDVYLNVHF